jgi:hypothetical protein
MSDINAGMTYLLGHRASARGDDGGCPLAVLESRQELGAVSCFERSGPNETRLVDQTTADHGKTRTPSAATRDTHAEVARREDDHRTGSSASKKTIAYSSISLFTTT